MIKHLVCWMFSRHALVEYDTYEPAEKALRASKRSRYGFVINDEEVPCKNNLSGAYAERPQASRYRKKRAYWPHADFG